MQKQPSIAIANRTRTAFKRVGSHSHVQQLVSNVNREPPVRKLTPRPPHIIAVELLGHGNRVVVLLSYASAISCGSIPVGIQWMTLTQFGMNHTRNSLRTTRSPLRRTLPRKSLGSPPRTTWMIILLFFNSFQIFPPKFFKNTSKNIRIRF